MQQERQRIANDQITAETITPAQHAQVVSATHQAQYSEDEARVALFLAQKELEMDAGLL